MNGLGLINATGQPAVSGSFHTLVVQPTSFYNLDCTYCYPPIGLFRGLLAPFEKLRRAGMVRHEI